MKTLAIYAGSFNPFHKGHLNILQKSERIFGKGNVLIAIGINPEKSLQEDMFSRAAEISSATGCGVEVYTTFLHELVEKKELEGFKVVIVRGLRNGDDLDYEVNQMRFVNDFKRDVDVVYITCDREFEHISSSAIRSLQKFRPGSADHYLI